MDKIHAKEGLNKESKFGMMRPATMKMNIYRGEGLRIREESSQRLQQGP